VDQSSIEEVKARYRQLKKQRDDERQDPQGELTRVYGNAREREANGLNRTMSFFFVDKD
jgi:hypothetical protein